MNKKDYGRLAGALAGFGVALLGAWLSADFGPAGYLVGLVGIGAFVCAIVE